MPKTIAITPSWYWPEAIDRVAGIPPYNVVELCVDVHARDNPDKIALMSKEGELSFAELKEKVAGTAAALKVTGATRGVLPGELNVDNIVRLLAALRTGMHIRILSDSEALDEVARNFHSEFNLADLDVVAGSSDQEEAVDLRCAAITICGKVAGVNHSHRSLLAASISLLTFLRSDRENRGLHLYLLAVGKGSCRFWLLSSLACLLLWRVTVPVKRSRKRL